MKRSLIIATLAIAGISLASNDASAGHRHRRCCAPQPACCSAAPSCAAPASSCAPAPATSAPQPDAAPAPAAPAPPPQANNANGYQSYSYEPGSNVPPAPAATIVPQRTIQQNRSFYDTIRADRKVRGTLQGDY